MYPVLFSQVIEIQGDMAIFCRISMSDFIPFVSPRATGLPRPTLFLWEPAPPAYSEESVATQCMEGTTRSDDEMVEEANTDDGRCVA